MNMDTITLYLKSVTDKMTNNLKNAINAWQQYDNATSKVANGMKNITNATNNVNSNLSGSKAKLEEYKKELADLTAEYERQLKAFSQRPAGMSTSAYNPTADLSKGITGDPKAVMFITQEKLDKEKELLDNLKQSIDDYEQHINNTEPKDITSNLSEGLKETGKQADNTNRKLKETIALQRKLGSSGGSGGSGGSGSSGGDSGGGSNGGSKPKSNMFNFKNILKGADIDKFTKSLNKGIDSSISKIKKLGLGLIGVRTAMSMLTKAVHAYLSFDSELQDSLTNSWNMLGSLLAPAIEFVARLFSLATNYIAQFVNALTGINLVARANAKALETQAKATKKASQAQRGLLSMDEITNLPTESNPSEASQIQIDDTIKSFKLLDDLINDLKAGEWHKVGEDIARGIDGLLGKINWDSIKEKAYNLGYNFADFLNGLFEVDWGQIGNTIAQTWNTFINLVRGFVEKFSFIQFGMGLGNMLNDLFLNIDWDGLATTINEGIKGLGDGISTFLKTFKWGEIGEKFGEFVANIDWGNLIFQAIKISMLAIDGLAEFLVNFFDSLVTKVIDNIYKKIDEFFSDEDAFKKLGKAIANGFLWGINQIINGLNLFLVPLRGIIVAISKVSGKDISMKDVRIPNVPYLEVGTPYVETEGLYHLHEGEMVTPKKYNPNANGYDNSSDNKEIIDLLVSLNANMLEYADRPIEVSINGRELAEVTYNDFQEVNKNRNKSTVVTRS